MNHILLITRPKYDDTTHYLFYWASKIITAAEVKGIQVLDLDRNRANKKEFTSVVEKKKPLLIFLNGHGSSDAIVGQEEIIIKVGNNENLLIGKIIYALSCKSARILGLKSIQSGAKTYLGYDEDFIFFYDPSKTSKPLDDKIAELFIEPSNQLIIYILKGHTTKDAHNKSKQLFLRNIHRLLSSESPGERYLIPYLIWDMTHQVCLGDQNAKF